LLDAKALKDSEDTPPGSAFLGVLDRRRELTTSQYPQDRDKRSDNMLIRTRTGVSVDGFIATPDGVPVFVVMPDFVPHESYGWPEFDAQIDAVVLGRAALDAGMAARAWPWPGKQIFVLTSRPVPAEVPADVVVAEDSPQGLLDRLRAAGLAGDAFLLGGRSTLHAFLTLGAIDRLELLEFPVLLGDGVPFSPPDTPQRPLKLQEHHAFPDGTIRHVYALG
jgi:dihydrofolate reductase